MSSDVSNTIFLQLLDQGVCSALPSLRCRFMTVLNTDFKCPGNLSSPELQHSSYGSHNKSFEVLLPDLPMSYFADPERSLTSLAHISAPCLSVLQLPSLGTPVNSFSAGNILIAIIYNCAIPLQSSASASRNLHNQGVENAIQHYFWASLIPHCTFNTQLPVKVW